MPKLKKGHTEENMHEGREHRARRAARGGKGTEEGARASKSKAEPGRVYRFKILRTKMPARRFIVAERSSRNPLSSLARALRISK